MNEAEQADRAMPSEELCSEVVIGCQHVDIDDLKDKPKIRARLWNHSVDCHVLRSEEGEESIGEALKRYDQDFGDNEYAFTAVVIRNAGLSEKEVVKDSEKNLVLLFRSDYNPLDYLKEQKIHHAGGLVSYPESEPRESLQ